MALRAAPKSRSKDDPIENAPEPANQRKVAEARYRLQVDRQTKRSFATLEAAEEAGLVIKNTYPIVQVSVYDSVDGVNKLIGADAEAKSKAAE